MNTLAACLFLLLDASGSVDAAEFKLQREATAAALTSPEFLARVEHEGGIAVAVAEFSGGTSHITDWKAIRTEVEAKAVADAVFSTARTESGSTAVGDAVVEAVNAMSRAPACERQVVDVSTDGRNNTGRELAEAIDYARLRGVAVNALVIEDEPGLLEYYRDAVNGFALPASWATYEQSLKMKMTLEIANAPHRTLPDVPLVAYQPTYAYVGPVRIGSGSRVYKGDQALVAVSPDDIPRQYLDLSNDVRRRSESVPEPSVFWLLALGVGFATLSRR